MEEYTKVKLVAVTNPVDAAMGSTVEEFIAYCARVSNPANQHNSTTAPKLLKYLLKNKHWSPFEMAHAVMEIETTRDIARQILRHRSFAFQEFSQRYAKATDLGFVTREARLQDENNRQASIESNDETLEEDWRKIQGTLIDATTVAYNWALKHGIAKEQARAVLPEGLTKSRLYMSGTLRSWIHFCQVRAEVGTQKEHRLVANLCIKELMKVFPSLSSIIGEEVGTNKNK